VDHSDGQTTDWKDDVSSGNENQRFLYSREDPSTLLPFNFLGLPQPGSTFQIIYHHDIVASSNNPLTVEVSTRILFFRPSKSVDQVGFEPQRMSFKKICIVHTAQAFGIRCCSHWGDKFLHTTLEEPTTCAAGILRSNQQNFTEFFAPTSRRYSSDRGTSWFDGQAGSKKCQGRVGRYTAMAHRAGLQGWTGFARVTAAIV
jgi:hypothetical protein